MLGETAYQLSCGDPELSLLGELLRQAGNILLADLRENIVDFSQVCFQRFSVLGEERPVIVIRNGDADIFLD